MSMSHSNSESRSRLPVRRGPFQGDKVFSGSGVRCYHCIGPHLKRFCPQLKPGIINAGAADYRRSRSPPGEVTFQTEQPEGPKEDKTKMQTQKCVGHVYFLQIW